MPVAQPVAQPLPSAVQPITTPNVAVAPAPKKDPAPNVDTIIRYNHAARDYDRAKAEMEAQRKKEFDEYERWKTEQAQAIEYQGVKVLPVPIKKAEPQTEPADKNSLNDYGKDSVKK